LSSAVDATGIRRGRPCGGPAHILRTVIRRTVDPAHGHGGTPDECGEATRASPTSAAHVPGFSRGRASERRERTSAPTRPGHGPLHIPGRGLYTCRARAIVLGAAHRAGCGPWCRARPHNLGSDPRTARRPRIGHSGGRESDRCGRIPERPDRISGAAGVGEANKLLQIKMLRRNRQTGTDVASRRGDQGVAATRAANTANRL